LASLDLQAIDCGKISSKQIEAARIAMTRHVKRGGKIWIRIFPDNLTPRSLLKSGWERVKGHLKGGWLLFGLGGYFMK
jgi:hypothetical protein